MTKEAKTIMAARIIHILRQAMHADAFRTYCSDHRRVVPPLEVAK